MPVRMAVIADPETAQGFRLAGLEGYGAAAAGEAQSLRETLVERGGYALVAVDEAPHAGQGPPRAPAHRWA